MSTLSATVLLILIMDPFGNPPVFVGVLKEVQPERRWRVLLRELVVARLVLPAATLACLMTGAVAGAFYHSSETIIEAATTTAADP